MKKSIDVLLVTRDEDFGQKIHASILNQEGISCIGVVTSMLETLNFIEKIKPDIVLVELLALPDSACKEEVKRIFQAYPQAKVIVLTEAEGAWKAVEAFRQGAQGHLVRDQTNELAAAIRAVHRGEAVISPALAGKILDETLQKRKRNKRNPMEEMHDG